MTCVPYAEVSSPAADTQCPTILAYCRVDMCGDLCNRLGNRKFSNFRLAFAIHAATEVRVGSVSSN